METLIARKLEEIPHQFIHRGRMMFFLVQVHDLWKQVVVVKEEDKIGVLDAVDAGVETVSNFVDLATSALGE